MEDIANNLKDPSWWFTAFFVAIIAGLVAGFLKDKITNIIGGLSSSLREWKEKKEKEQEIIIDALANNEAYLNIALFRVVVALILFAVSVVIYMTAPGMLSMAPQTEDVLIPVDRAFLIWKVFLPLLGMFTVYIGFNATSRISTVYKAIKKYREINGLPKIP